MCYGGLENSRQEQKHHPWCKVEVGTEEVSVDLYTIIEYGQPIQKVAQVQENVRKNIEAMTGLHVVRVDVHVQGVSFEKEKREVQKSLSSAKFRPAKYGGDEAVLIL